MSGTNSSHGTVQIGVSLAYFRITSQTLTLAEIISITQEDPDEGWSLGEMYTRRGMHTERPRSLSSWKRYSPAGNAYSVQDSLDGLYEHVERIVERISSQPELSCSLQVVQYFLNPKAEIEFKLNRRWVTLLDSIPASLDVDQYR